MAKGSVEGICAIAMGAQVMVAAIRKGRRIIGVVPLALL
jgi:hypothetical protein